MYLNKNLGCKTFFRRVIIEVFKKFNYNIYELVILRIERIRVKEVEIVQ